MSFRFGMPVVPPDGRVYREEDRTAARLAAASQNRQRQPRPSILDDKETALSSILPRRTLPKPAETPSAASSPAPGRRHVVTPDPVSFRYLEEDPCVNVIDRRASLEGYELYVVEQWVCSRQSPTIVIATYTGDPNHSVVVGVLSIPQDEKDWSPRLQVYFTTMGQYHARPKDSPFGEIMATNLSSFPSALTVIAVTDGDIRRHRQEFIVNEDLKRLGCSGRSGLTLSDPTRATQEKFQSLYKTSEKIPFAESVPELIKQCQTALFIFGMLEPQYIDGLLCDVTETAISDWWTEVGAEYYNAEPSDGILGPSTVAALLGMLMGARNRLAWYGAPVSKDVFDIDIMKKGIGSFQKDVKLERTRRLDHQTLRRLHSVTIKAAAGESGWGVQKAIKNTVEGFGGKRGELVFGMVGGKDKGNVGDIETLDIDKFIGHIYGERPKWLWFGKPRRSLAALPPGTDHFQDRTTATDVGNGLLGKDDSGLVPARRVHSAPPEGDDAATPDAESSTPQKRDELTPVYSVPPPGSAISMIDSHTDRDKDLRKRAVFKSVAGRVSDARSGLGRIRDAVGGGLRSHASRPSRDDTPSGSAFSLDTPTTAPLVPDGTSPGIASLAQASLSSPVMVGRAFTWKNKPEEYLNSLRRERELVEGIFQGTAKSGAGISTPQTTKQPAQADADTVAATATAALEAELASRAPGFTTQANGRASHLRKDMVSTTNTSVAGSVADDSDLEGPILEAERNIGTGVIALLRRHSIAGASRAAPELPCDVAWPRRLSFSAAEEAVLTWEEIVDYAKADENAVDDDDDSGGDDDGEDNHGSGDNGDEKKDKAADGRKKGTDSYDVALLAATAPAALAKFMGALTLERGLYKDVASLRDVVGPVVLDRVLALESLDAVYENQLEDVQGVFFQLSDAYERVQASSHELLGMERTQGAEAIREIEVLMAKVEYEIGALVSKVHDVEEGVRQFTQQVEYVEKRAEELKKQLETESWLHWFVRSVTGIGTGPNIIEAGRRRRP